ncbi:putative high-affinity glucose transporter [Cladorrhinum sp. PSN259]|nr:putative high-affinity glucose transporter [Cladorrhinum sp. PSN259]
MMEGGASNFWMQGRGETVPPPLTDSGPQGGPCTPALSRGRGLLPNSPISDKIPSPSSSTRLPSNIPLRTLPVHDAQNRQSLGLLSSSHHGRGHAVDEPGYSDSEDDDADGSGGSSWIDTGDIAEQLDDEDPLRKRINETVDDETLAGIFKRHPKRKHHKTQKRVHYQDPSPARSSRSTSRHTGVVNKEAIQIPNAAHRSVSKAERILAAIMTGSRSSIHGLTGKPLLYFTSIFVSLGVFLFGYDQGVMSGVIMGEHFKIYFGQPSKAQVATMVAILEIGALISSLMVGHIGDIIGRRKTILYGSCIFFVGGALQAFSLNVGMMMGGRIIAGLGVGMLSTIVPVYQSEISPPHNRGKLACIEFSGNIVGYTTSVWVDYFCGYIDNDMSWRLPLFMQCVMGALLGLGSLIIVESPRWLLDNDHDEEGIVVIANLYGGGDIHDPRAREEFRDIKMDVLIQRQEGERTYREMFKRYGRRVFIAMSAQALAQLNGINVISYYAPMVFEQAGWQGLDTIKMAGVNGITYLLATIPPWYIVDRWGRRPILLTGAVAMVFSLSAISYSMYINVPSTPMMVVILVMIYNAAFGYSWGPIPWLYPPEILPLKIRSKGASLSTATNWLFNYIVGQMTPILQEWITWRLYLIHAFFCALSFVVVYFLYPETCGVRLEDMDVLFGDATGALGTPVGSTPNLRAESDPLVRSASPIPPLDIRNRHAPGRFGPGNALPGLNIDPPVDVDDRKSRTSTRQQGGGLAGWLSRIMGRRSESSSSGGQYAPIDQRDD